MTPKAQLIAICEFCGWTEVKMRAVWDQSLTPPTYVDKYTGYCGDGKGYQPVPDYMNDLNAVHKAEKKLSIDDFSKFCKILNEITCPLVCGNVETCGYSITAEASKRVEAILKAVGKWI